MFEPLEEEGWWLCHSPPVPTLVPHPLCLLGFSILQLRSCEASGYQRGPLPAFGLNGLEVPKLGGISETIYPAPSFHRNGNSRSPNGLTVASETRHPTPLPEVLPIAWLYIFLVSQPLFLAFPYPQLGDVSPSENSWVGLAGCGGDTGSLGWRGRGWGVDTKPPERPVHLHGGCGHCPRAPCASVMLCPHPGSDSLPAFTGKVLACCFTLCQSDGGKARTHCDFNSRRPSARTHTHPPGAHAFVSWTFGFVLPRC